MFLSLLRKLQSLCFVHTQKKSKIHNTKYIIKRVKPANLSGSKTWPPLLDSAAFP